MKYFYILLILVSPITFADEQYDIGKSLTHELLVKIYDDIIIEKDVKVTDKGNYVLVDAANKKSLKFYAFTKATHPGHPGYIEWDIRIENGQSYLDTHGRHGENGKEFHLFESTMNKIMVNYVKHTLLKKSSGN